MEIVDRTRALRRHHNARIKRNRQHYWAANGYEPGARRRACALKTPARCSCPACGNPRKFLGLRSLQEIRNLQKESHEWRDYDDHELQMA